MERTSDRPTVYVRIDATHGIYQTDRPALAVDDPYVLCPRPTRIMRRRAKLTIWGTTVAIDGGAR